MLQLPNTYSTQHERVILKYLVEGRRALSQTEWKLALAGFDLLRQARMVTETMNRTFAEIYEQYVDQLYADPYIAALLSLQNVVQGHEAIRARFARLIVQSLSAAGLRQANMPETNLLLAYCLYFWESFAIGYAFEVEIYRDLSAEGIAFAAHDLRNRNARFSAYDLEVLTLQGDIKTSLYFLEVGRGQGLPHDFYITRFYESGKQRTLVVMLQLFAWEKIDGETVAGALREATRYFPKPVRVELEAGSIIVADYALWKQKIWRKQTGGK